MSFQQNLTYFSKFKFNFLRRGHSNTSARDCASRTAFAVNTHTPSKQHVTRRARRSGLVTTFNQSQRELVRLFAANYSSMWNFLQSQPSTNHDAARSNILKKVILSYELTKKLARLLYVIPGQRSRIKTRNARQKTRVWHWQGSGRS